MFPYVCVRSVLCLTGVCLCVWGRAYLYQCITNKTYIYKRYRYIYISCARVCVSLGVLQVILSGEGDVPLFVTQPVTAMSGNASCAVCDRDSSRGELFPALAVLWQGVGACVGEGSASLEVESRTLCSCVGLFFAPGASSTQ